MQRLSRKILKNRDLLGRENTSSFYLKLYEFFSHISDMTLTLASLAKDVSWNGR